MLTPPIPSAGTDLRGEGDKKSKAEGQDGANKQKQCKGKGGRQKDQRRGSAPARG